MLPRAVVVPLMLGRIWQSLRIVIANRLRQPVTSISERSKCCLDVVFAGFDAGNRNFVICLKETDASLEAAARLQENYKPVTGL